MAAEPSSIEATDKVVVLEETTAGEADVVISNGETNVDKNADEEVKPVGDNNNDDEDTSACDTNENSAESALLNGVGSHGVPQEVNEGEISIDNVEKAESEVAPKDDIQIGDNYDEKAESEEPVKEEATQTDAVVASASPNNDDNTSSNDSEELEKAKEGASIETAYNDGDDDAQGTNDISEQPETPKNGGEDVTSNAAIAFAAVAAAATANNTSPEAAGKAARALAPDLVPEAANSSALSMEHAGGNTFVCPSLVKMAVNSEEDSPLQELLKNGDGDFFLMHLMALQGLRAQKESPDGEEASDIDTSVAKVSAKKVVSILSTAEESYSSFQNLLSTTVQTIAEGTDQTASDSPDYKDAIIPDLLPPCATIDGDVTQQFFDACCGEPKEETKDKNKEQTNESSGTVAPQKPVGTKERPKLPAKKPSFSAMFSSVTKTAPLMSSLSRSSLFANNIFGKNFAEAGSSEKQPAQTEQNNSAEYTVVIEEEMLGLTVENVLERTIVRSVLPNGSAKKAGAKVGSLIVSVGNVETKNLTHFETIDELRKSQRPLTLVLRQVNSLALRSAREEMGRLIRGDGFGASKTGGAPDRKLAGSRSPLDPEFEKHHHHYGTVFGRILRQNCANDRSGKAEAVLRVTDRLVWNLTLLVIGLEKEAINSNFVVEEKRLRPPEDFVDAARSVSKDLLAFINSILYEEGSPCNKKTQEAAATKKAPRTTIRGKISEPQSSKNSSRQADKKSCSSFLLHKIGDLLQRTGTFLADPMSPPAALLRGEIISLLCDILDIDSNMAPVEQDSASGETNVGSVIDLGHAGSLLKLIILSCTTMRSPTCTSLLPNDKSVIGVDFEEEQRRRFGQCQPVSELDLHRLHAGNRFLSVVHRLAASRCISARKVACSLGPILWGLLDFPHQLQVRVRGLCFLCTEIF